VGLGGLAPPPKPPIPNPQSPIPNIILINKKIFFINNYNKKLIKTIKKINNLFDNFNYLIIINL
jgi:hypothetical protein